MACRECELLREQAAVADEEVQKIREQIVAGFSEGSASPALIKALEAAERTQERCLAVLERHARSHDAISRSSLTLHSA